jgi:hypothetical protein
VVGSIAVISGVQLLLLERDWPTLQSRKVGNLA